MKPPTPLAVPDPDHDRDPEPGPEGAGARVSGTLSFVEFLENRLRDAPPRQKGLRTRARLKLAAAKILEDKGYHAMRIIDVTTCAEVAEGSFYVYFKDKTEISLDVLTSLLSDFFSLHLRADNMGAWSPFTAIRDVNRRWIALSRANSGLMRCLLQLADENPDFAGFVQTSNRQWYERVVQSVGRRHRVAGSGLLLVVYLLGAMMDELVRKLIVYPDKQLRRLMDVLRVDDEAVADAASLIWLRVLYPEEPPPDRLSPAVKALAEAIGGA